MLIILRGLEILMGTMAEGVEHETISNLVEKWSRNNCTVASGLERLPISYASQTFYVAMGGALRDVMPHWGKHPWGMSYRVHCKALSVNIFNASAKRWQSENLFSSTHLMERCNTKFPRSVARHEKISTPPISLWLIFKRGGWVPWYIETWWKRRKYSSAVYGEMHN